MEQINHLRLWELCWGNSSALLGSAVIEWGACISCLYAVPKTLGLSDANSIRSEMAAASGDGRRLEILMGHVELKLSSDKSVDSEKLQKIQIILSKLNTLIYDRNNLIHGLPVLKRLDGEWQAHLSPASESRKGAKSMRMPEAAEEFLTQIRAIMKELFWIAAPLDFEEWEQVRRRK